MFSRQNTIYPRLQVAIICYKIEK